MAPVRFTTVNLGFSRSKAAANANKSIATENMGARKSKIAVVASNPDNKMIFGTYTCPLSLFFLKTKIPLR